MSLAQRRQVPAPARRSQSIMAAALRATLKGTMKPLFHPRIPTRMLRAGMRLLTTTTLHAPGVRFQPVRMDQVDGELASPASPGDQAILYLHGGAYCVGSSATHRAITSHLAQQSGACVFTPDYRLAPEHPFPAATDDALGAYRWLLDNGYEAADIFLAGDSAGGGLALATAMQIRDQSLPAPGGLILLSPWADLTLANRDSGATVDEVMLSWQTLDHAAEQYASEHRGQPLVSPLRGSLANLPPTLIIVGTEEILLQDSEQLFETMAAAGGRVTLSVYQDMWHVFPIQAGLLESANTAIAEMAEWMKPDATISPAAS
jgi:epsilon-lactone hydrolase